VQYCTTADNKQNDTLNNMHEIKVNILQYNRYLNIFI